VRRRRATVYTWGEHGGGGHSRGPTRGWGGGFTGVWICIGEQDGIGASNGHGHGLHRRSCPFGSNGTYAAGSRGDYTAAVGGQVGRVAYGGGGGRGRRTGHPRVGEGEIWKGKVWGVGRGFDGGTQVQGRMGILLSCSIGGGWICVQRSGSTQSSELAHGAGSGSCKDGNAGRHSCHEFGLALKCTYNRVRNGDDHWRSLSNTHLSSRGRGWRRGGGRGGCGCTWLKDSQGTLHSGL